MSDDPAAPRGTDLDLPWYAVGRLEADATARIDAALADDPELSRRVALARQERDDTVALNEGLGLPSAAARQALFARIDADTARPAPLRRAFRRISGFLSQLSPPTLATAALAAAAIIAVQATMLSVAFRSGPETRYTTASAPGAAVPTEEIVLVGFVPTATAAAVTALIEQVHATIVSGPRPGGLYELRIADHRLAAPDLDGAMARLRDRTDVVQFVASESGTR